MFQRFQGADGARRLECSLKAHSITCGSDEIAKAIVEAGTLQEILRGTLLICEGHSDDSIFLIIAGSFEVRVKGRPVAVRRAGDHVGEIAAIDPTQRRSATVVAQDDSVVIELTEPALARIAERYPAIWRRLAVEASSRLGSGLITSS